MVFIKVPFIDNLDVYLRRLSNRLYLFLRLYSFLNFFCLI